MAAGCSPRARGVHHGVGSARAARKSARRGAVPVGGRGAGARGPGRGRGAVAPPALARGD
ncbi:MAG: hypothetical protein FJ290_15105 [Planctomycetes bacterium]|nr:hypothetical protein [Planctomycetota bacterium]